MKHPYLQTGKIVSTHGVHGEVKLLPWADGPEFLLQFHTLYLDGKELNSQTVGYAAVIVATIPVLFAYPFLQRFLVSGFMVGSVKE